MELIIYRGPACHGRNMAVGDTLIRGNGAQGGQWAVPANVVETFEALPQIRQALDSGQLQKLEAETVQARLKLPTEIRVDAPELSDYPETLTLDQFKGMADLFGLTDREFKAVRATGVEGSGRNGTAPNSAWYFPKTAALEAIKAYLLSTGGGG